MKTIISVFLALAALTAAAAERPEVGRYVHAYSGEENATVYVVRLGAQEKAEALIMVTGVDDKLDGVIQKAAIVNEGYGRRSYRIKGTGGDYEILRLERESGTLFLTYQPNNLNEYRVKYSQEASREARAEHILTQWLEQGVRKP